MKIRNGNRQNLGKIVAALFFFTLFSINAVAQYSSFAITVAGGNGSGQDLNQFNNPGAVFVDSVGNIYVEDNGGAGNHRILKFPPTSTSDTDGVLVTGPEVVWAGGNGPGCQVNQPALASLYFDRNGNIYVADEGNNRILEFPAGSDSITNAITIAGGNGQGNAANQFYDPKTVYVDDSGNLFVADGYNDRIQKFPRGSDSTTNGITVAKINDPWGVWLDAAGNIFVTSYDEYLTEFPANSDSNTVGTTIVGGIAAGDQPNELNDPAGICLDQWGNIYVVDAFNNRIQKFVNTSIPLNDTVWPGDANNDGVANNLDILSLGLAYGYQGSARTGASSAWKGQPCPAWPGALPGGINANHADCNGDGVVNANDTVPILLNYGLTHPKRNPYQRTSGAPTISLVTASDSVGVSTPVNASVNLGDVNIAAQNVMAIAFTINYDPTLVKDSTPVFYAIKSWLGTPDSDLIYIQRETTPGSLDVGITRTDHAMVSGEGQIGTFGFVTIDNLSGKSWLTDTLKMNISNVEMIMNDGTILPVNTQGDSIPLFQEKAGITGVGDHPFELNFYPNPTTGAINYTITGLSTKASYTLDDMTGRTLLNGEIVPGNNISTGQLELSSFANGVYFFRMNTTTGNVVKKIVLQ